MPIRKKGLYGYDDPFWQDFAQDYERDYAPPVPPGPTSTYTSSGYQAPAEENPYNLNTDLGNTPPENSMFNTGSYGEPGYIPTNFASNPMAGWDATKWADPNHQTPKYAIGRILSQYDPSPENLQKAMAEIQKAYPGTELVGTDNINIPGVGMVDVGGNFTKGPQGGASSWWWGNEDRDQSAPSGGGGAGGGGGFGGTGSGGFGGAGGGGGFSGGQTVGADPFSQMIDSGISQFLSWGGAPSASSQASQGGILDLIGQGGQLDPTIMQRNLESVREGGDRLRKSQTNTLRAQLADRGLLAEPGYGSGPERTGLERIEEDLGAQYAGAFRDIGTNEMQRSSDRYTGALGLGAQQGAEQSRSFLSGLQTGTTRQDTISRIAMDSLGQNMEWNKFLASFGLERDRVMADIQQGKIEGYLPLIQMFIQMANQTRGGYV